jgi:hypothetical protein
MAGHGSNFEGSKFAISPNAVRPAPCTMSTPQETYDAMALAGAAKIAMPWHKQAIQGFMYVHSIVQLQA